MRSSTARWPTTRAAIGSAWCSRAVTQVLTAPQPTRLIEGPDEALLAFTAELEGGTGDGFLLATRWAAMVLSRS